MPSFLKKLFEPIARPFRFLGETRYGKKFLFFAAIVGPGIITAAVDNDAGGITTYSIAGAHFGYMLLWTMVPVTILLIITQEMCQRMGVVTGKGLADLIRESYGVKVTFFVLLAFLFANLGTTMSNFAGVAASLEIFHISRFITVPIAVLIIWTLVMRGRPRSVEKIFLFASLIFLTYIISGFLAHPDWGSVFSSTVTPSFSFDKGYLLVLLGVVGTTVTPWMQFYLQATVVQKGIKKEDIKVSRWDTIVGGILTDIVAFFIIVATAATLFPHGITIESAKDAALALQPFAGRFAELLFAIGLLNASLFAGTVVPLATSYSICEGMGWEHGIGKKWKEAGVFNGLFTAILIISAIPLLVPGVPLIKIMIYAQVVNGILLCPILIYILRLVNKEWLMGQYKNTRLMNILGVFAAILLTALSLGFVATTFF